MIKNIIKDIYYLLYKYKNEKNNYIYLKTKDGDLSYYETPIGNYYLPNNVDQDIIINYMRQGKLFDSNIIDIARQFIKPNTTVLDIGCNLGQMSIYFSKLLNNTGKVFSFDADDYIFEIFKKNIHANKCQNIEPIFAAVYNQNDRILIFPKQDFVKFKTYGSYGLDLAAEDGRKVKTITIDSLKFDYPISFMKIDVQGSDLFALQGARETINKYKMPIIFEFEEQFQDSFDTNFGDYVDFVHSIDYKFVKTIDQINYLIMPR